MTSNLNASQIIIKQQTTESDEFTYLVDIQMAKSLLRFPTYYNAYPADLTPFATMFAILNIKTNELVTVRYMTIKKLLSRIQNEDYNVFVTNVVVPIVNKPVTKAQMEYYYI